MDPNRGLQRKRKANQHQYMEIEAFTPPVKTHVSEPGRVSILPSPARRAVCRSASDASGQTHLICGELLDLMSFDSRLDVTPRVPSTSGSSASGLTVTTATSPRSPPSGAYAFQYQSSIIVLVEQA